ncbi:hypothetical protein DPMN_168153 [Dreissena polymorpha]|uniref:Uncharacterized protein n=1 Tax=Dreissena polymorpha TaxID=45954 RepID=A0A9D4F229_DREPO|nr:hypothetical protein DPMN_168153 [Dreissena polymorpha]
MFHFGYGGSFLEEFNRVPQSPNTAVSIYRNSALFAKGGKFIPRSRHSILPYSDLHTVAIRVSVLLRQGGGGDHFGDFVATCVGFRIVFAV